MRKIFVFCLAVATSAGAAEYDQLYRSGAGGIAVSSVTRVPGGVAFTFADVNGSPVHPRMRVNGREASILELPQPAEPRAYEFEIEVESTSGPAGLIDLSFYPRELYAAAGNSGPGRIIVNSSTLVFGTMRTRLIRKYDEGDLAWARRRWAGDAGRAPASDTADAQRIVSSVMRQLVNSIGIPSDAPGTPRDMFERAVDGKDEVWCDQLVQITHLAMTAAGLDARVVRTGSGCNTVGELCFWTVDGHVTMEYYSREEKGWFWIDPSLGVLAVSIGETDLSLNQLTQIVGTPMERELRFRYYDARSRTVETIRASDPRIAQFLASYIRSGVKLTFD